MLIRVWGGCVPGWNEIQKQIIGKCPALLDALDRLACAAKVDGLPILITGETGTGKELAARLVHVTSRPRGPFVAFNCASVAKELMESEFFGHEKGAFSGAIRDHAGLFEQACGGTLFLDEIGEMAPELQAKLLRVLQEMEIRRVGSQETRRVDVRIVTATHCDLDSLVRTERFRPDLYYRLSGDVVAMPPLRDRGNDILLLARHFLKKRGINKRLSREAAFLLLGHRWSGNIRELKHVIDATAGIGGRTIRPEHLPDYLGDIVPAHNDRPVSREQMIPSVIDRLGAATRKTIVAETSLSVSTLKRELRQMVASGELRRAGKGRYTEYSRAQDKRSLASLNARQRIAFDYVQRTGRITRRDYSEQTGASMRTAARDLSQLVELGKLKHDGRSGKAAGYTLP